MSKTIIPAQPGFFVVYIDAEDEPVYVETSPVVAWEIETLKNGVDANPITYDGQGDIHGVVFPDGRARHYVLEETFGSVNEMAAEVRRLHLKRTGGAR